MSFLVGISISILMMYVMAKAWDDAMYKAMYPPVIVPNRNKVRNLLVLALLIVLLVLGYSRLP